MLVAPSTDIVPSRPAGALASPAASLQSVPPHPRVEPANASPPTRILGPNGGGNMLLSNAEPKGTLTPEQQEMVRKLQARDAEVRRHEQAHAAAGGQYAGAPSYTYQTGPDGRRYAIGGEVPIDVSPVRGDPEATIQKMEQVKSAALAPAEPSSADRRIAALAEAQRLAAIAELAAQRRQEAQPATDQVDASRAFSAALSAFNPTDPATLDRAA